MESGAYPDFVSDIMLEKGFLTYLEQIRKLNDEREIPIASYISYPRSSDVVNALRVALCPSDTVDSDKCSECSRENVISWPVSATANFLLSYWRRGKGRRYSSVHQNTEALRQKPGALFYLKLDEEIARIEIPQWVAQDENGFNLVHTLVLDQCKRGQGYPVALGKPTKKPSSPAPTVRISGKW